MKTKKVVIHFVGVSMSVTVQTKSQAAQADVPATPSVPGVPPLPVAPKEDAVQFFQHSSLNHQL